MIGYKQRIELAKMRLMAQLPVRTHLRKDQTKKPNHNYAASKIGGKLGRKASGL